MLKSWQTYRSTAVITSQVVKDEKVYIAARFTVSEPMNPGTHIERLTRSSTNMCEIWCE